MRGLRYVIVDVFAERPYAGNQLAVFLEAGGLDGEQMQALAHEMNFSESTFVLADRPRDGGWDVRIFTPREEIPFAGHPTLGTSWVIARELLDKVPDRLTLNLGVGPIPVEFRRDDDDELLWMRQRPPEFLRELPAEEVAPVLGLAADDFDRRFPVQEVSTGIPFLIVPLTGLDAVQRARVHGGRYEALAEQGFKAIFVFSAETGSSEAGIHARMFADAFGVPEDPATGSANGCLAGWLVRHAYLGDGSVDVIVEQGVEMGRPSRLHLRARANGDAIEVEVGGRVFPVARGELL